MEQSQSLANQKAQLRREMEAMRGQMPAQLREERSQQACGRFFQWLDNAGSLQPQNRTYTMFAYLPFRTELDLSPVIENAWRLGWTLLVPSVDSSTRRMRLHAVKSYGELSSGSWGIREPAADTPQWHDLGRIDIAWVPGLAFDREGRRLGYGGGYYDRFFAWYGQNGVRPPLKLAMAFDCQLRENVPAADFDLTVDVLFTERQTIEICPKC